MLREIILSSALLLATTLSGVACSAETLVPRGTVCWPLHFAGITLGITNDAQLRRLLGNGIHRRKEGDTGGRYFIDRKKRATLHAVMYTDSVVGELTVLDGLDSSLQKAELENATSGFFDPDEGFGNWHALHLGSSKADTLKNLGEPSQKNNDNEWIYTTSCACELPEFFTIYFKSGRLFQVVFSAPAG